MLQPPSQTEPPPTIGIPCAHSTHELASLQHLHPSGEPCNLFFCPFPVQALPVGGHGPAHRGEQPYVPALPRHSDGGVQLLGHYPAEAAG
jgi:hypothetical protein